jgi:hypothetical protein
MRRTKDAAQTAGKLIELAWQQRDKSPYAPERLGHGLDEPWPDFRAGDRLRHAHVGLCGSDLEAVAVVFDLPMFTLFSRPDGKAKHTGGGSYIQPMDFVALLIDLAHWGLPLAPEAWVRDARLLLQNHKMLTKSEIAIWWWHREQAGWQSRF